MQQATTSEAVARARQDLETVRLLGVDFVPRPATEAAPVPAPPEGASTMTTTATDGATRLEALAERHARECPHCTTATGWTKIVFGEGDPDTDLMFIGEAPGEEEDRTGRPFVGRAGRKLEEIISAMGRRREDVFIANVLKTRPPNNRTPLTSEVEACAPYLADQIRIIRPGVIVALGGPSTKFLLDTTVGITRLRGQWAEYVDPVEGFTIPIMPTFHPAYLLRNYTPDTRGKVWSDMQAVVNRLAVNG